MPSLKLLLREGPPRTFPVFKRVTTLGRDASNDISLRDDDVRPFHVQLVFDGRDFSVSRVGDSPHFYINGKKRKRSKLLHSDKLRIGESELTFSLFEDGAPRSEEADRGGPELAAMRRLVDFTARLASAETVSEQLRFLVDAVLELTSGGKAFVLLLRGGDTQVTVARDCDGNDLPEDVAQLSDSILSRVIETRRALLVTDASNDTLFRSSQSVMNLQLSSVMCAPLVVQGQLLGILYVGNRRVVSLFTQESLDLLTLFASQAALILQSALLRDELKHDRDVMAERLQEHAIVRIVGTSPAMERVRQAIDKLASSDVSVLIQGETGTGKELIARELHRRSPRSSRPFVAVNCGAIPENLMESELFGHVRGAFTGATATQRGKFEMAHGGTLFLDEIAEMPPALQVKLLRVLQEREVTKVGAARAQAVDIRVLSATHQDLEKAIEEGRFREDLFYRLRVVALVAPALRDRAGDIRLLAHHFLRRLQQETGSPARAFTDDALHALERYPWPGNVRELENRIRRALVLATRPLIEAADLDLPTSGHAVVPLAEAREAFQRRYVREILERNNGNRTQTARDLGVDPRTIFRYLEKGTDR